MQTEPNDFPGVSKTCFKLCCAIKSLVLLVVLLYTSDQMHCFHLLDQITGGKSLRLDLEQHHFNTLNIHDIGYTFNDCSDDKRIEFYKVNRLNFIYSFI